MTADSFRVMLAHAAKIPSTATHSQLNVRAGRGLVGEGARPKDHLNAEGSAAEHGDAGCTMVLRNAKRSAREVQSSSRVVWPVRFRVSEDPGWW